MKPLAHANHILVALIILLPLAYAATVYPTLPATIPTHFGIDGQPNAWGSRDMIWFTPILFGVISTALYLLIRNLPKIDPKKAAGAPAELYNKLSILLVVFLCAINLVIMYATVTGSVNITKVMLPLLGLFFLVMGNYMHSIKPNYFIGLRVPWTLENEDNWRKTHQLMSKYWVAGGVLMTLASLVLPRVAALIVFGAILVVMTVVPVVYSYRYFRSHPRQ